MLGVYVAAAAVLEFKEQFKKVIAWETWTRFSVEESV